MSWEILLSRNPKIKFRIVFIIQDSNHFGIILHKYNLIYVAELWPYSSAFTLFWRLRQEILQTNSRAEFTLNVWHLRGHSNTLAVIFTEPAQMSPRFDFIKEWRHRGQVTWYDRWQDMTDDMVWPMTGYDWWQDMTDHRIWQATGYDRWHTVPWNIR